MIEVEFMGKSFMTDESGFIDNYDSWCEEWVEYIKKEEGIKELTEEHRKVLEAIRKYYEMNGLAPMVRILERLTGMKREHFWELFPSGPGKGACRMAGLPKPSGCV